MGAVLEFAQSLETSTCSECGIVYAMPASYIQKRRNDGGSFTCPNGHSQIFRETEVQKLKRELEAKNKELQSTAYQLKNVRDLNAKHVAKLQRTEKQLERAKKGVCPCCKRSFTALRRHMETQHPEWKPVES